MINKEREITMDRICRSCMSESENMKNVFESRDIKGGQDIVLAEMLMACASVEVNIHSVVIIGYMLPNVLILCRLSLEMDYQCTSAQRAKKN